MINVSVMIMHGYGSSDYDEVMTSNQLDGNKIRLPINRTVNDKIVSPQDGGD